LIVFILLFYEINPVYKNLLIANVTSAPIKIHEHISSDREAKNAWLANVLKLHDAHFCNTKAKITLVN